MGKLYQGEGMALKLKQPGLRPEHLGALGSSTPFPILGASSLSLGDQALSLGLRPMGRIALTSCHRVSWGFLHLP